MLRRRSASSSTYKHTHAHTYTHAHEETTPNIGTSAYEIFHVCQRKAFGILQVIKQASRRGHDDLCCIGCVCMWV